MEMVYFVIFDSTFHSIHLFQVEPGLMLSTPAVRCKRCSFTGCSLQPRGPSGPTCRLEFFSSLEQRRGS